jgi:hypothetical protein
VERAEADVRNLVAAYADAVNSVDAGQWASTWDEKAVWDLGRVRAEGRDAIVELWRSAMASYERVIQMVCHGHVAPGAESARWTIWELGRKDGVDTLVVGCYLDRYVHDPSGCRFAERRFTVAYRGELARGEFFPFPPIEA